MDKNLALETLKSFVENTDNVIAKDAILALHPELAKSKDERIRNLIYCLIRDRSEIRILLEQNGVSVDNALAYLEKQKEQKAVINIEHLKSYMLKYLQDASSRKDDSEIEKDTDIYARMIIKIFGNIEQKPAEWSEEFLRLMGITISQDGNQVCVLLGENLAEGIAGFGDTLADAVEEFKKEWRQFDRLRKAIWKPSEEQIEALEYLIRSWGESGTMSPQNPTLCAAKSLLNELKKL